MHPIYDPWGIMLGMLQSLDRDRQRRERINSEDAEEAVRRCGFKVEYRDQRVLGQPATVEIVNGRDEPLNKTEKSELAEQFKIVKAERAERMKKAAEAEAARRAEEAARRKAEYEATALPFREERARRKREAWLKRQPKQRPS